MIIHLKKIRLILEMKTDHRKAEEECQLHKKRERESITEVLTDNGNITHAKNYQPTDMTGLKSFVDNNIREIK